MELEKDAMMIDRILLWRSKLFTPCRVAVVTLFDLMRLFYASSLVEGIRDLELAVLSLPYESAQTACDAVIEATAGITADLRDIQLGSVARAGQRDLAAGAFYHYQPLSASPDPIPDRRPLPGG